jgi:hypothetical protein
MAGEQPAMESPSMEDRLAAQFETDQPETQQPEQPEQVDNTPEPESETPTPEFVETEFNGKTYQVPPELKDALMAQSDYTRKTTEVAEQKKAIEQQQLAYKAFESERKFNAAVKDDIARMQEIDFSIKQWKLIDVTGMTSEQLWQVKTQVDNLKEEREGLSRNVNSKWNTWQQEQIALANEAQSKAQEAVAKSIKGWGPEAKAAMREYALNEGYTAAEIDTLADPRMVKTIWKAQQYDKLQAQKVQGKVQIAPTVKPGSSNPMPQQVKDKLALKKQLNNPGLSSAQKAKAIERELMNRF